MERAHEHGQFFAGQIDELGVHSRALSPDEIRALYNGGDGISKCDALGFVNRAPTDITLSRSDVDENSADGTIIGTLSVTDPDVGDSHMFTLVTNPGDRFGFSGSGSDLVVAHGNLLDFESSASHTITVRATDVSGASVDKDFTITVNNINEAPVAAADRYFVVEGFGISPPQPEGVLLGDSDPENDLLSVTLVTFPAHAAGFSLNRDGSFTYVHDGSETTTEGFTYIASDGALQSGVATVLLFVAPFDDPPTSTSNGGGDTASVRVAENTTAVTAVTDVDATDPDSSLTFSIPAGTDAAQFSIDASRGVLTFNSSPDFENPADANGDNVYEVVVQASDGSLMDTQAIMVEVFDVFDPPAAPTGLATVPASPANDNTPLVMGFAKPNAIVRVYPSAQRIGVAIGQCMADESGFFSIEVAVPDNSTTNFFATASNAAGTSACSRSSATYFEDSSAPTVEATIPDLDRDGALDREFITLAAFDTFSGVASIAYSIDGAPVTEAASPTTDVTIPEGTHIFSFWATDRAGNSSSTQSITVMFPDNCPIVPNPDQSDSDGNGKIDTIELHFVDGKRGDDDMTANGVIVDPGAPAIADLPPTVTRVKVGSSVGANDDWAATFRQAIDRDDLIGFPVPFGGDQLKPLPWSNIRRSLNRPYPALLLG